MIENKIIFENSEGIFYYLKLSVLLEESQKYPSLGFVVSLDNLVSLKLKLFNF